MEVRDASVMILRSIISRLCGIKSERVPSNSSYIRIIMIWSLKRELMGMSLSEKVGLRSLVIVASL